MRRALHSSRAYCLVCLLTLFHIISACSVGSENWKWRSNQGDRSKIKPGWQEQDQTRVTGARSNQGDRSKIKDTRVCTWPRLQFARLHDHCCRSLATEVSRWNKHTKASDIHFTCSSNREHLSYDVCLEVRGEIIRIVLCCIVYCSCAL